MSNHQDAVGISGVFFHNLSPGPLVFATEYEWNRSLVGDWGTLDNYPNGLSPY